MFVGSVKVVDGGECLASAGRVSVCPHWRDQSRKESHQENCRSGFLASEAGTGLHMGWLVEIGGSVDQSERVIEKDGSHRIRY